MILLYLLIISIAIWYILRHWPVRSVIYIKEDINDALSHLPSTAKLVDVRDAVFYDKGHVPGSINLTVGRMPYLWKKELDPGDDVILVAKRSISVNRAARFLHKRGFRKLYAILYR